MKSYNYSTRRFIDTSTGFGVNDKNMVKVTSYGEDMDALITSDKFISEFKGYVEDIAMFKTTKDRGTKRYRNMDYASVGILDRNDIVQESYLAFLEAYNKFKELDKKGKFNHPDEERGAAIWSYLKSSTAKNLEYQIREVKDGIRVPEREYSLRADSPNKTAPAEYNFITKLFGSLEAVFSNNVEEVATSKWDTDLTGYFLEVHMDEFLDLTRGGKRDLMKNEREVLKALYGIDQVKMTYKEVSDYYQISESTIRSVKERAIKRLKSPESKELIASFLHEYRIKTSADIEKYKNN